MFVADLVTELPEEAERRRGGSVEGGDSDMFAAFAGGGSGDAARADGDVVFGFDTERALYAGIGNGREYTSCCCRCEGWERLGTGGGIGTGCCGDGAPSKLDELGAACMRWLACLSSSSFVLLSAQLTAVMTSLLRCAVDAAEERRLAASTSIDEGEDGDGMDEGSGTAGETRGVVTSATAFVVINVGSGVAGSCPRPLVLPLLLLLLLLPPSNLLLKSAKLRGPDGVRRRPDVAFAVSGGASVDDADVEGGIEMAKGNDCESSGELAR